MSPDKELGLWRNDFLLSGGSSHSLGCDSLELLSLSAAVNEMFHLYESHSETDLLTAFTFGDWVEIVERGWRNGPGRLTFSTSGSTGKPKRCTHELSHLKTEIEHLAERFADRKRIVSIVRAHHIYGFLFTAMLADALKINVLPAHNLGSSGLFRQLQAGDLLVSIPNSWQWLERSFPHWPQGVHGVASTASCPEGLVASLMARGLAGMTEIYGSSETAGVATRTWPETTYTLMPHWRFTSEPGLAQCLIHASGAGFDVMDVLGIEGETAFSLGERYDAAVQVGGINVYPDRIAAHMRDLPCVFDAAVRLMRPDEGTRLKAFIVPASGWSNEHTRLEVESWIEQNLVSAEKPKSIEFGSVVSSSAARAPEETFHSDIWQRRQREVDGV